MTTPNLEQPAVARPAEIVLVGDAVMRGDTVVRGSRPRHNPMPLPKTSAPGIRPADPRVLALEERVAALETRLAVYEAAGLTATVAAAIPGTSKRREIA